MAFEEFGYGAGGGLFAGIIGAVLTAFNFRERVKCLEEGKLSKEVFLEYRHGIEEKLKVLHDQIMVMDSKLDLLLKR